MVSLAKPLIVVITLQQDDLFRSVHTHLWDTLVQKANVRHADNVDQARRALSSAVRPHAVIAADGFVTRHAYRDIVFRLVEYARAGGTVLYAGCLSSFVGPLDLSAHFETVWNVPWRFGEYYRADFTANPSSTTGVHLPEIVKTYSMKTVLLDNVASGDALYLDEGDINTLKTKRASNVKFSTPATFTRIGAGRFGFVGDVNGELATSNLVVAMCLYPGSRTPASPGTGIPAPGSTGSISSGLHAKPEYQAGGATTVSTETLPRIFILSLQNKRKLQEEYCQIFSGLSHNASVTVINDASTAATTVSAPPHPGDVVLVADAGICEPAYTTLLYKLILFAQEGATVVLGMDFCMELPRGDARTFFGRWGLPWDFGEYHRTTFALNPAGVPKSLSARALQPSYSMKAVHLKGVPRNAAVYLPTADSHIESHVFQPTRITGAQAQETPAAFARTGKGFLGYVGDVNGEQGSARLTIEMCGVKVKSGDIGCRRYVSGTTFRGGKVVEEQITEEPEEPLPYASNKPSRAVPPEQYTFGSGVAMLVRNERGREEEVRARAEARARVKAEKDRKVEVLAKEGIDFTKKQKWAEAAEKYRAAALLNGPHPIVLSNLAWVFIKLKQWAGADSAAGRALLYDPNNARLLFRRGLARKGMSRFEAAEADFKKVVSLDGANTNARAELQAAQPCMENRFRMDWPGDDEPDPAVNDRPLEPEDESDTEDFKHDGNGTPCKFYNGPNGCNRGKHCQFRHAPDSRSVRDELGRNVCLYWLVGECMPTKGGTCAYAHDATYLPAKGWWNDSGRLARLRAEFNAAVKRMPLPELGGAPEKILAEALRPASWRNDLWVTTPSTVAEDDDDGSGGDDGW